MKMKHLFFLTTIMIAAFCVFGTTSTWAQDDDSAPGQGGRMRQFLKNPPQGVSTEDWQRFKMTALQVIQSNPDLKSQLSDFRASFQAIREKGEMPSQADIQNFKAKLTSFKDQVKTAILQKDPSLAPVCDAVEKVLANLNEQRGLNASPAS